MSTVLQPTAVTLRAPDLAFLSIAAPAYNEEDGIAGIVSQWLEHLRRSPHIGGFEIVVCNDGSQDNTGALLDRVARENPEVRPVHLDRNRGAAVALSTAIGHTRGDWVLLIDSDGQFPDQQSGIAGSALEREGGLAATGVRAVKQDNAFARFGSWSSGALCNWFHGSDIAISIPPSNWCKARCCGRCTSRHGA